MKNHWKTQFPAIWEKCREKGKAGLLIELDNGMVTVKHSETMKVLSSFFAYSGTWDKIFKSLKKIERENDAKIK